MDETEVTAVRPLAVPGDHRLRLTRMFAAYHESVWRFLRRRGLSPEQAADATQETFVIALGRLADIPEDSERAFLMGTARRVAHTLGRKTVRWQLDDDMDQHISSARDAHDQHADLDLCDLALAKLSPELSETFVLYEIEGLSAPEISILLAIPVGSVASRLRRAREQFRDAVSRFERGLLSSKGRP